MQSVNAVRRVLGAAGILALLAACSGSATMQDRGATAPDRGQPGDELGGPGDAEPRSDAELVVDAEQLPDATDGAVDPDAAPLLDDAGPAPDGPGLADYPLPPIPASCPLKAKVVTYNPNGWSVLTDAFEANPTPCADYFIHLPALAGDKTAVRGPLAPQAIRARKGRFHAAAEFHWGGWSQVSGMSWYEKGVEFRRRMDAQGYNVARGDTWAINELPSSTRKDATVRKNVRDAIRGLYTGPAGAAPRGGIVFVVGMGQNTVNHSVYKPLLKTWLADAAFWTEMNKHVLYWGQETYASPTLTCVGSATVGLKSQHLNAYIEHPAKLAVAGATAASAARAFFNVSYFSLQTAVWKSTLYGGTNISLANMKHFVSLQAYAARAWAASHNYPDGRVGFAWYNNVTGASAAEVAELAQRLAAAIAGAYAENGTAARACSPSGAYTWCACNIAGSAFNTTWSTYESW